jgi:hypothetical protein
MCAMYRVVVCNWPKEDAIAEMRDGGFNFNRDRKKLVSFVESADVAGYRRRLGLIDSKAVIAKVN